MSLLRYTRPKPEEIFTPRRPLNEKMYSERRMLETKFQRALRGSRHIAIFGDSGNGKTWLYQKVLKEQKCGYVLVDLSVAKTSGLDNAFRAALEEPYGWQADSHLDNNSGGIKFALEMSKEAQTQYTFADEPPFDKLVNEVSRLKGNHKFIVFDNLESVVDDKEIVRQLTAYILRLDNPTFAAKSVRFLFVGVVTDIRKLLSGANKSETISNRLNELPEVKRMSHFEAETVFRTGFLDFLNIDFGDDEDIVIRSCVFYSGRSAQHIHEIGLQVAFDAEEYDWSLDWDGVAGAIREWADSNLEGHNSAVRARLNQKATRIRRKNQVMYSIARLARDEFSVSDVDHMVRLEFPHNTEAQQLGIDQILKGLTQGEVPILNRDSSMNKFRFANPKLRLAIRNVLVKDDEGDVAESGRLVPAKEST